jgi:hypothetical protein
MDGLAPLADKPGDIGHRMRLAAADLGIGPEEPLAPLIEASAAAAEQLDTRLVALPRQLAEAIVPLIAIAERSVVASEKAADRPLITGQQLRYDVVPLLLAVIRPIAAVAMAGALTAALGIGWSIRYFTEPALPIPQVGCQQLPEGLYCGYWAAGPIKTEPTPTTGRK